MNINILSTYDEMCQQTAEFIMNYVNSNPEALLCFPAGNTPEGVLSKLVQLVKENRVNFTSSKFISLDEWVKIAEDNEGSCKYFLYKHFFKPLKIREENIVFFNAMAEDMALECARISSVIQENKGIDLLLLGIGMNGHLGLNEPGVSFDLNTHVVNLDPVTMEVGQKYFDEPTQLKQGITIGIKDILDSSVVILIANGVKKSEIVKKALCEPVSEIVPASVLQVHRNAYVFLDQQAASLL